MAPDQAITAGSPQAPGLITRAGRNKMRDCSPLPNLPSVGSKEGVLFTHMRGVGSDWEKTMRCLLREELNLALQGLQPEAKASLRKSRDALAPATQTTATTATPTEKRTCQVEALPASTTATPKEKRGKPTNGHDKNLAEEPAQPASQLAHLADQAKSTDHDAKHAADKKWKAHVEQTVMGCMHAESRMLREFGASTAHNEHAVLRQFHRLLDWFAQVREPERIGSLAQFIDGAQFQTAIAAVILINAIYMGVVTDYLADGRQVTTFMATVEIIFTCVYAIEIGLKLKVHKQYFFCNDQMEWNIFDFALVMFALFDVIEHYVIGRSGGLNAGFIRALKILKAGKVLRIFRLVRFFHELRLILNVLLGSMLSLFWSLVMMASMYYICGLVFVQGVTHYRYESEVDHDPDRLELIELYFGSVRSAMLYMFMMNTGGAEWSRFYELLTDTGTVYSALYLCFVAFSQVAFLNVLTALFVENATQIAKPDREDRVIQTRHDMLLESKQLAYMLKLIDKDGSGMLGHDEFMDAIADPDSALRIYMESDGLDVGDAILFFDLIKSCGHAHTEEVDIKAFIKGLMKIRGVPTALDVQAIVWQAQLSFRNMNKHFVRIEHMVLQMERLEGLIADLHGPQDEEEDDEEEDEGVTDVDAMNARSG